ncbi:MAG: deoxyribonuclease V [Candidatus Cloacimonadota bacterium]|nr:deoxyribonuclease V [Candidatus Cloacimonadota bacterium]
MNIKKLHNWQVSSQDAINIQNELKNKVILECPYQSLEEIKTVAGCDVNYEKKNAIVQAAVVLIILKDWSIIEKVIIKKPLNQAFPYIPGLLSFREAPFLLLALQKIKGNPDIILFDGQGIAHPRRLGLATHIGILIDKPTIGCAKSLLCGKYEEPKNKKGAYSFIKDEQKKVIGAVLRTRKDVKPVFVSQGYKISLDLSLRVVLACSPKYRIPEPLRLAHYYSKH